MKALRVSRPEFEAVYCRWAPSGGFETRSVKETPAYDCVLWDKGCSVYESRPLQCRAFPFWRTLLADEAAWKSAAAECPGMGSGEARSREEIDAFLAERDAQPFIQRRITL
jgi:Fe-S-cluster containining protein